MDENKLLAKLIVLLLLSMLLSGCEVIGGPPLGAGKEDTSSQDAHDFQLTVYPTSQTTTVNYAPTTTLFPNPERGFYHHTETHSNNYTPLDLATLQHYRQNEQITLILRVFYLEEFVNGDINQVYLDAIQADFAVVRQAGLKSIIRFAYTDHLPPAPPYGDATKAQILKHLEQLKPILQANSDVIAAIQAGFIGVWGEWYYTDHFVTDPTNPSQVAPSDWSNRAEVLTTLLEVLPDDRMFQVRTPLIKQEIVSRTVPISAQEAHRGSHVARIGYHNDCFLASETDYGTYSFPVEEDKTYLQAESEYVPVGGETCAHNPPRSECPLALEELARFHWSYLNVDYHPAVLAGWKSETPPHDCFNQIKLRLGYRFRLIEGIYADEVRPGDEFAIDIKLSNDGWAAPFNPHQVELLLRHTANDVIYAVTLPDDPRFWLPDRSAIYSLTHTICTPTEMPPGDYSLLLNLPDPEPSLYLRPEYAIRLANEMLWEDNTGYNMLLHKMTVNAEIPSFACTSPVRLKRRAN